MRKKCIASSLDGWMSEQDVTGWGCETTSGRESGRLKCRSAETPWALVSAGLAVFEKDLGYWPLRPPADPCYQSILRPALWRVDDSWDGRAAVDGKCE